MLMAALVATVTHAGTAINTNGSTDAVAIMGYDSVEFFIRKKAVKGSPDHSYQWAGAKWTFINQENLQKFKEHPERWHLNMVGTVRLAWQRVP